MGQAVAKLRPIASPDARRICTLSGVQGKLYSEKLIQLQDLETTLDVSIKEAESAIKDEVFATKVLIGVRVLKLGCDLTIDILSRGTGPGGKAVSMIYDRATLVVDGLNGSLDGKKVGQHVAEVHVDVVSDSLEYVGKEGLGKAVGHAKTLVKTAQSLNDIYGEYRALQTAGQGTAGARQSLLGQLQRVRVQLASVKQALADCGLG